MSLTDQQKADREPGQGAIAMGETAKYCDECSRKLSPADTSPQDRAFFDASLFTEGPIPRGSGPLTEEGLCDKCGKSGVVIYCET
jgi:hypothetical protein